MKFLKLLMLYTFASMVSISAYAEPEILSQADPECADVLVKSANGTSVNPIYNSQICKQDWSLMLLDLMFTDAYKNSDNVKLVYQYFNLPEPSSSSTVTFVSSIVSMLGLAIYRFTVTVGGMLLVFVFFAKGYKLAQGEKMAKVFADSGGWKQMAIYGFGGASLMGAGYFGLGQEFIVFIAFLSVVLVQLILSPFISAFGFQQSLDSPVSDPSVYTDAAINYANDMVKMAASARTMASAISAANAPSSGSPANKTADDLAVLSTYKTSGDGEWPYFEGEDMLSPTVHDYVMNAVTQPTVVLSLNSPVSYATTSAGMEYSAIASRGFVNTSTNLTYNIKLGQSVSDSSKAISTADNSLSRLADSGLLRSGKGAEITEPHFDASYYEGDLFERPSFGQQSMSIHADNTKMLQHLLDTGFAVQWRDSLYTSMYDSNASAGAKGKDIVNNADKLIAAAEEYVETLGDLTKPQATKYKQQYIKNSQAYLLGYLDHIDQVSISKRTEYFYNPLRANAISSNVNHGLIRDYYHANQAAQEYVKHKCNDAVFTNAEHSNVISQVDLMAAFNGDEGGRSMNGTNAFLSHSLQCLTFSSGAVGVLLDDGIHADLKKMVTDDVNKFSHNRIWTNMRNNKQKYEAERISTRLKINTYKQPIITKYANVMAITKTAGQKITLKGNDDAFDVMSDLRRSGFVSLMSYFVRIAKLNSSILEQISGFDQTPTVSINADDASLYVAIDENVNDTTKQNLASYMMSMGRGFSDDIGVVTPDYVLDATDAQKEVSEDADWTSKILSYVLDAMIPGDQILKDGFGFDEGLDLATSYRKCADEYSSCMEFKGHPVVVLIAYGQDLIETSIYIMLTNLALEAITMFLDSLGGDATGAFGGLLGGSSVGSKVFSALDWLSGGKVIKIVLGIAKAVMGALLPFAGIMLTCGIMLGFVLALAPVVSFLFAVFKWASAIFFGFVFSPLLSLGMMVSVGDEPLVRPRKFVGMHIDILMRASLIVVAFGFYYVMSYALIALINVSFGGVLATASGTSEAGVYTIDSVLTVLLTIIMLLYLYFKALIKFSTIAMELPDKVANFFGIESFTLDGISEVEGMLGSHAMSRGVEKGVGAAGQLKKAFDSNRIQSQAKKIADAREEAIAEKLQDEHGIDLTELMKGGKDE